MLSRIRRLLSGLYEIAGTAQNGPDLLVGCLETAPDLVVSDIAMPGLNGIEVMRRVRERNPAARFVFLSNHFEGAVVEAAMEAGAAGFVAKPRAAEELVMALREAAAGRRYVSPSVRLPTPRSDFRNSP